MGPPLRRAGLSGAARTSAHASPTWRFPCHRRWKLCQVCSAEEARRVRRRYWVRPEPTDRAEGGDRLQSVFKGQEIPMGVMTSC